jgi:hypothetical protein
MPYTRPGVEAAVRLSKLIDKPAIWTSIESKYNNMLLIKKKGNSELQELDAECEELGKKWRSMDKNKDGNAFITCEELYQVMKWKFAKGKSRPLWKYINSNTEEDVRRHSKNSFSKLSSTDDNDNDNDDSEVVKEAIKELSNLKGLGAAGSSAILSLYKPDLFVFMDDEVIESLYSGKREYNMKVYIHINDKCKNIATQLGDGWNARRVGRALWTAATVSAYSDEKDLTVMETDEALKEIDDNKKVQEDRPNKRKRRKTKR